MLNIGFNDAAGRSAYLAAFHAAQGLISEKTGRTVKTHKGVHTEFLRLTRGVPDIPSDLRGFLSHAYNLKAVAEYETANGAEVSGKQAKEAFAQAKRFVACLVTLLA